MLANTSFCEENTRSKLSIDPAHHELTGSRIEENPPTILILDDLWRRLEFAAKEIVKINVLEHT